MALRDLPYLPLYVQDFMSDEKLIECNAAATGVYIRLMCLMHKNEGYGRIALEDKYKIIGDRYHNFANKLVRHMPYPIDTIEAGLRELSDAKVIKVTATEITQKRMIRDNEISELRAAAGKKGAMVSNFSAAKEPAKKTPKVVIVMPWEEKAFIDAWELWKRYKREQWRFTYKPIGEQSALNDLANISEGNMQIAIELIYYAMSKGWRGIFRNQTYEKSRQQAGASNQQLINLLAAKFNIK